VTPALLLALEAARRQKIPVVMATRLPDGAQFLLPEPDAPPELNAAARQALEDDKSGTIRIGEQEWFVHVYNPKQRLIVVGAVHIAQALVPFAAGTGYAVTVVDPRRSFASDERFPDVTISTEWRKSSPCAAARLWGKEPPHEIRPRAAGRGKGRDPRAFAADGGADDPQGHGARHGLDHGPARSWPQ
jgi:xanthine dehydrogenase accessory factor